MAKAIALYVNKNSRSASPKYLLGESYGGFRAAKTARALQRDQGIAISGIVMLSPLLEAWLTFGDDQSALRAALQLPSLAAAELDRKHAFTPAALAAAEKFAMTDYLVTLAGPQPQGPAAKAFYDRVADISGLPVDVVTRARGFVENDYVKNMRPGGKIVSRYDAAFAVDDPYPDRATGHGGDPILDGITRAYGGGFVAYARNELGFKTDMTYSLLAGDVTRGWDWQGNRATASVEDDLRTLLAFSRSFRMLIAHGYFDMVTPYAMSRYVLDHLPPTDPPARAQLKLYRGGHMLYLDPQSRKAFRRTPRRSIAGDDRLAAAVEFQHVEADVAVDHVNQPALVEHHVVALRRGAAADRIGNETADFARRHWIGDVDDAQAAAEPDRMHQRAGHALVELMRAEARARRARERRIEFAHLEQRQRLHV